MMKMLMLGWLSIDGSHQCCKFVDFSRLVELKDLTEGNMAYGIWWNALGYDSLEVGSKDSTEHGMGIRH